MRKQKVNPCCWMKGRYGGKRAGGRHYPHSILVSGCECRKPFASIRPLDFPPLQYALTLDGEDKGATVAYSGEKPKGALCTVPCDEVFRHTKSRGTRCYRRIFADKTKFKGCQLAEEDLVAEKLIRHDVKEILGLAQAMDNASEPGEEYNVPDSAGVISTSANMARYFLKLATTETNLTKDKPVRPPTPKFGDEELDITPIDLKHQWDFFH